MASCFFALRQNGFWSYRRSAGRRRQSGGPLHVLFGIVVAVVDCAAGGELTTPVPAAAASTRHKGGLTASVTPNRVPMGEQGS